MYPFFFNHEDDTDNKDEKSNSKEGKNKKQDLQNLLSFPTSLFKNRSPIFDSNQGNKISSNNSAKSQQSPSRKPIPLSCNIMTANANSPMSHSSAGALAILKKETKHKVGINDKSTEKIDHRNTQNGPIENKVQKRTPQIPVNTSQTNIIDAKKISSNTKIQKEQIPNAVSQIIPNTNIIESSNNENKTNKRNKKKLSTDTNQDVSKLFQEELQKHKKNQIVKKINQEDQEQSNPNIIQYPQLLNHEQENKGEQIKIANDNEIKHQKSTPKKELSQNKQNYASDQKPIQKVGKRKKKENKKNLQDEIIYFNDNDSDYSDDTSYYYYKKASQNPSSSHIRTRSQKSDKKRSRGKKKSDDFCPSRPINYEELQFSPFMLTRNQEKELKKHKKSAKLFDVSDVKTLKFLNGKENSEGVNDDLAVDGDEEIVENGNNKEEVQLIKIGRAHV